MVESAVRPREYYLDPSPIKNPSSPFHGKAEIYPIGEGVDDEPEFIDIFGKRIVKREEQGDIVEEIVLFYVSETPRGIPNPDGYRQGEHIVRTRWIGESLSEPLYKIDEWNNSIQLDTDIPLDPVAD